ncbi:MAG: hypothetical protein GTO45_15670 [Candidatus Aminicenantes bacterium]|nr:hypothetical protein [Candidatus Aminicenantes bacterium]NIN19550.1 hypothetical protein [Candidatus Aminicenantes bacterium]NIN43444.1 hypothetical protein [Candidatus Aminicenantes bacterium]NIN86189.1 hypothetical protein [Candidatus Aminicenantes bacterium]NIO82469.1 hypothetical protein [Candidatus Aminicenantes bacterium]
MSVRRVKETMKQMNVSQHVNPKILFALSHSLCYNHSMLDSNFEINNLDLAEQKVKTKVYIEKISHAIL